MPMKTPSDLAPNEFVQFMRCNLQDGTLGHLEIRLLSTTEGDFRYSEGKSETDHHPNVTQIFLRVEPKVWVVDSVDASEAGWGPFLYDIAMELATMQGCGLRSHESNVNEHARRIWQYYATERQDISRKGLPRTAKRPRNAGPLRHMYFKKSPDFTNELKANGKWKECERTITEWG